MKYGSDGKLGVCDRQVSTLGVGTFSGTKHYVCDAQLLTFPRKGGRGPDIGGVWMVREKLVGGICSFHGLAQMENASSFLSFDIRWVLVFGRVG